MIDEPGRRARGRCGGLRGRCSLVGAAAVAALAVAAGCGPLNRSVDRRALEEKARFASAGSYRGDRSPPPYQTAAQLERLTRPAALPHVVLGPGPVHRIDRADVVEEEWVFDSAVHLERSESDRAQLWVYRHGPLGERPVVLWVPGLYVSEVAFPFIDRFTGAALDQGADVVFYVPPYHLTRTPKGFESGDAVLATGFADHLAVSAQEIADLRESVRWLRSRGVVTLGAFAGSMGANAVLRILSWEPAFDFATLLIPLLRWDELILGAPAMAPVRARLAGSGWTGAELARVYRAIDVSESTLRIPAARLSVLYGRWDQVAPAATLERWASAHGVTRLRVRDRGHSLMLVDFGLYGEYRELLREDLAAMADHPRPRSDVALPPAANPPTGL